MLKQMIAFKSDWEDVPQAFHITYDQVNGGVLAKTTVNGHAFVAKGRDQQIAARQLTERVTAAVEHGQTTLPPQKD